MNRGVGAGRGLLSFCIVFAVCLFLNTATTNADPVWGEFFELDQPDGSRVEVLIWGDEFYRVVESLDGYTLVRDPATGVICYARLSADGNDLVSTGVRVGSAAPAFADEIYLKSGGARHHR